MGSLVIFTSQVWKLQRGFRGDGSSSGSGSGLGSHSKGLIAAVKEDASGFGIDAMAGVGGLAYFIGSVLFLPEYVNM